MAEGFITRVDGLKELVNAYGGYRSDLAKEIRRELVQVGKPMEADARSRLSAYNSRSAGGIRIQARATGTMVLQQRYGRVTGKRPDWGALQMRKVLIPARAAHTAEIFDGFENMLDRLAVRHGF